MSRLRAPSSSRVLHAHERSVGPPQKTLHGEARYEDEFATLRLGIVDNRIAWIHLTPYLD